MARNNKRGVGGTCGRPAHSWAVSILPSITRAVVAPQLTNRHFSVALIIVRAAAASSARTTRQFLLSYPGLPEPWLCPQLTRTGSSLYHTNHRPSRG